MGTICGKKDEKYLCWSINSAKLNIWEQQAWTGPVFPQAHVTGTLQDTVKWLKRIWSLGLQQARPYRLTQSMVFQQGGALIHLLLPYLNHFVF